MTYFVICLMLAHSSWLATIAIVGGFKINDRPAPGIAWVLAVVHLGAAVGLALAP